MPITTWARKWALITGASAGIGKALAEELAQGGTNLVLTARRAELLASLAADLVKRHNVCAEWLDLDLAIPGSAERLASFCEARSIDIDLLINNAGIGTFGPFVHIVPQVEAAMVALNCASVVEVTHRFLAPMIARRRGDILILSSTAAFQPVPYMSVYAATKAFDLLFAEALAQEVKRYGVRVCALCPGSTESDFDRLAGIPTERTATVEPANVVARRGLEALRQGRHLVISGWLNRAQAHVQRLASRRLVAAVTERMFRP